MATFTLPKNSKIRDKGEVHSADGADQWEIQCVIGRRHIGRQAECLSVTSPLIISSLWHSPAFYVPSVCLSVLSFLID